MPNCCIKNCKSNSRYDPKVPSFCIGTNPKRLAWLDKIGRADLKNKNCSNFYVCAKHFLPEEVI